MHVHCTHVYVYLHTVCGKAGNFVTFIKLVQFNILRILYILCIQYKYIVYTIK